MAALVALALFVFGVSVIDLVVARRNARRDAWLSLEDEAARRRRIAQALRPYIDRTEEP